MKGDLWIDRGEAGQGPSPADQAGRFEGSAAPSDARVICSKVGGVFFLTLQ